jgi:hypothetical protein
MDYNNVHFMLRYQAMGADSVGLLTKNITAQPTRIE